MEESGLQTERTDSSAPHEELFDDTCPFFLAFNQHLFLAYVTHLPWRTEAQSRRTPRESVLHLSAAYHNRSPHVLASPLTLVDECSQLIADLHLRGINVRYLLHIYERLSDENARLLVLTEAVARVVKHRVEERFRRVKTIHEKDYIAELVAEFSLLFSSDAQGVRAHWQENLKPELLLRFPVAKPLTKVRQSSSVADNGSLSRPSLSLHNVLIALALDKRPRIPGNSSDPHLALTVVAAGSDDDSESVPSTPSSPPSTARPSLSGTSALSSAASASLSISAASNVYESHLRQLPTLQSL